MIKSEKPLLPYSKPIKVGSPSPGPPTALNPIKELFKKKKFLLIVVLIIYSIYLFFVSGNLNFKQLVPDSETINTFGSLKEIKIPDTSIHSPSQQQQKTENAVGQSESTHPIKSSFRIQDGIEITTVLGLEAELSYKLGVTNLNSYRLQLENFIRFSFPEADSNEANPGSLINAMRAFFPLPSEHKETRYQQYSPIPQIIFQTSAHKSDEDSQSERVNSWSALHPDWNITFHDDKRADEWVRERFSRESYGNPEEDKEESERGVVGAWNRLTHPTVLRSDFWRYLVVCSEGGVYADTDVEVLKPVEQWGINPGWEGLIAKDYVPPSFIAGVEADVGDRADWHTWYPRPLELSQWTFASSRGHPILIDAIRRVVADAYSGDPEAPLSVVERTGPGCFTDSVFRFLKVKYSKSWHEFRGLGEDGWRYFDDKRRWGDVKILSITGFSPGAGHMGSGDATDRQAMSKHWFAGSWKGKDDGADGAS